MGLDPVAVVEGIGRYEEVQEQECMPGTPLGHAYGQGWNAAMVEVLGRLRRAQQDRQAIKPCVGPYGKPFGGSNPPRSHDGKPPCPTTCPYRHNLDGWCPDHAPHPGRGAA